MQQDIVNNRVGAFFSQVEHFHRIKKSAIWCNDYAKLLIILMSFAFLECFFS